MRKFKKVSKKITVDETIDILCNICGNSCDNQKRKKSKIKNNFPEYSGLIETTVQGGFGSEVIGDMVSCRFSICEHCLVEQVFSLMKIKPEWSSSITDFVSQDEFQKKNKQEEKRTINEYLVELKKLDPKLKDRDLKKMNTSELNKLYFELSQRKRKK